jgi:hypothetical protein
VDGEWGEHIQVASFERFTRDEDPPTVRDNHTYYTSTYFPPNSPQFDNLWVDLASMADGLVMDDTDTLTESELSGLHRFYEVHDLGFEFPFYGHTLDSVAVTTGGFIYTGDLLHDQVHITQFIAPLQADFNPNVTDTGRVLVLSTDERFTVQWDQVHNHDHVEDGPFTFQVSIFPSGEIHFVYQEIPLQLGEIDNGNHPVEVGLSDAFYISQSIPGGFLIRVFEYHRVSLGEAQNLTNSAYILTPVLNCVTASNCEDCATISATSDFNCGWCDEISRCSDGVDRNRQEWVQSGCALNGNTMCTLSSSQSTGVKAGIAVGVILVVSLALLLLLGVAIFFYAYRNPNSRMGQFMIKHRPKARTLNKTTKASYEVSPEKAILDE